MPAVRAGWNNDRQSTGALETTLNGGAVDRTLDPTVRPTTAGTRLLLLLASILVFLVGVQLYVLTGQTEKYFAWTVRSPLTAAFLGGAYWASFAMEFFASRRRVWANARIAIPAVLVFTALTLVVTLVHLDQFHLHAPEFVTRFVTWTWLFVYAVVPPIMVVLLIRQVRVAGRDPDRIEPLAPWFRTMLIVHAAVLLPMGIALLVVPEIAADWWPWTLTPLTGRAIGAWLVGLGIAAAQAAWENDPVRIGVAAASYLVFGVLELIAIARFPDALFWDSVAAWMYLAFLLSTLVGGAFGWRRAWQLRSHP